MTVAVVVPWRGGCPHRERAWRWIEARYRERHPDWEIIEAGAPRGPWCKAAAVTGALIATGADLLVVADADVWTDNIAEALPHARAGRWAIPHRVVRRLTEPATTLYMDGGDLETLPLIEGPYVGVEGGGIVVLSRELYGRVPLDSRFNGWGGEDESWGHALNTLAGRPWRGLGQMAHLFHPPQERMSRKIGSLENEQLTRRYARARHRPDLMRPILEEVAPCSQTC